VQSNPAPAATRAEAPAAPTLTSPILGVDWARVTVWGLYLVAALMPSYVIRWHIGPIPTTLLEVIILATAAAYVLSLYQGHTYRLRRTPIDIPIVLLLVAGLISIVIAYSHTSAAGIYRAYFLEAIAVFYIAVDVLQEPRHVRGLLIAAGVGSVAFGVGQLVTFALALVHHEVHLGLPPSFIYTSSNSVALFLEPPLVFAAAFALYPSKLRERYYALACLAFLVPAAAITLSRGLYAAVAVLVVIAVFTVRDTRQKLLITAAACAIAVILLLLPIVQQRLTLTGLSFLQRLVIYDQAWTVLSNRPLTGAGLASYVQATAPLRSPHQWPALYPHNIWLAFWSETGLLGLVSFASLYSVLVVRGWRAIGSATGLARPLLYGGLGTLIVYFVHGMVDTPYWKNDLAVEFWLVAALIVVALGWAVRSAGASSNAIADQANPRKTHR
jgi:O-antigen ligase